ncbi:MAG TPA: nitroreductase, partial [Hyphomicrobiaceae bacterium]|nr:nitroreductase [Hyphomicrobiaceae bacterium]
SAAELEAILTAAARVPDHKKLVPWRFIVFEGEARADFGRVLLKALQAEEREAPSAARLETERTRLMRAPTVVAVISRVTPNPAAPEWEQVLSCGAACFNLCLAANALGFGTSWITEWYSYSRSVQAALGLARNERVAGFIYIGTAKEQQADRDRPQLEQIVSRWNS